MNGLNINDEIEVSYERSGEIYRLGGKFADIDDSFIHIVGTSGGNIGKDIWIPRNLIIKVTRL